MRAHIPLRGDTRTTRGCATATRDAQAALPCGGRCRRDGEEGRAAHAKRLCRSPPRQAVAHAGSRHSTRRRHAAPSSAEPRGRPARPRGSYRLRLLLPPPPLLPELPAAPAPQAAALTAAPRAALTRPNGSDSPGPVSGRRTRPGRGAPSLPLLPPSLRHPPWNWNRATGRQGSSRAEALAKPPRNVLPPAPHQPAAHRSHSSRHLILGTRRRRRPRPPSSRPPPAASVRAATSRDTPPAGYKRARERRAGGQERKESQWETRACPRGGVAETAGPSPATLRCTSPAATCPLLGSAVS